MSAATTTKPTTAPETTKTPELPELPELAQQVREQLLSTVKQGQHLTLDAVQSFAKAAEAFPTPKLPKLPEVAGAPTLPDLKAVTVYTYDLAIDLLTAQREFAVQLATAFTPAKSA